MKGADRQSTDTDSPPDGDSTYVCDLETKEDVVRLTGHTDAVTGGALVRNETEIYTSSEDGTIK